MSNLTIEGHGFGRTITLNDGYRIPMFGLGLFRCEPKQAVDITAESLQKGYRLLDTAVFYGNEKEVGEGVRKSGIKRENVYVVTKVNDRQHGYEEAVQGVKESIEKFGMDYIDLVLIHSPKPGKLLATYDGLLKVKQEGLVRSVGVSNFGVNHLEEMRKAGKPTPSVNQFELNCFWRKEELVKYCHEHGIAVMGFSPIFRNKKHDHPVLNDIAKRYNKSVAQLMIRWSFQKDYITIPKSSNPVRIVENANIFDFVISDEDMKILDSLPAERCVFPTDITEMPWLG
ncbi:uncharacterized protein LOC110241225 isoform X2 [Exaiptasia diaphana]|uniref:NADP-dependent oxidoreductase domain-containing protein n=1 Tax=Exaiptasia diaphana TaxID=2652724 RepID=A0A913XDD4_EXADI|nr:uncharacterized protein LOC110241225 isoform X2 [Exaiptasia diaphana]